MFVLGHANAANMIPKQKQLILHHTNFVDKQRNKLWLPNSYVDFPPSSFFKSLLLGVHWCLWLGKCMGGLLGKDTDTAPSSRASPECQMKSLILN